MNTLTVNVWVKKNVYFLPEIWYTLLGVSLVIEMSNSLFRTGWCIWDVMSLLLLLCVTGLIGRQFFKANGWVSLIMGSLFALGACYMSLALLSEYREFPLGTEPEAISLIAVGSFLCGLSLVLALWMLVKGIRQIQS